MGLSDPSDQPGDPLGWAGNQAGHMLIGAASVSGLMLFGADYNWALGTSLFVWASWEIWHLTRGGSKLDGAMDFLAFTWGMVYPLADGAGWWSLVGLLALASGLARRVSG